MEYTTLKIKLLAFTRVDVRLSRAIINMLNNILISNMPESISLMLSVYYASGSECDPIKIKIIH